MIALCSQFDHIWRKKKAARFEDGRTYYQDKSRWNALLDGQKFVCEFSLDIFVICLCYSISDHGRKWHILGLDCTKRVRFFFECKDFEILYKLLLAENSDLQIYRKLV